MLARRIAITAAVLALAWRGLVWTSLEPTPLAVALGIMGVLAVAIGLVTLARVHTWNAALFALYN